MNASILTIPAWSEARKLNIHGLMPRGSRPARNIAVGNRLRLARMAIDSRVSQVDFAKAASIRSTTYNQWETGENFPGLEYALALCDRYPGLTLDWIYRAKKEGMPSWLTNAITALEEADRRSVEARDAAGSTSAKVVQPRQRRRIA